MHSMSLFAHAYKSLGLNLHPTVQYIAIGQPASVKIWEMLQLGRDRIIYTPA